MPLLYQQDINEHTRLGLWHINEPESFFLDRVELTVAINHPHKRLQHLAGRFLLTELFPDFPLSLVKIADTRKPFLEEEAFHFSISHSRDYAAALVSRTSRVGVDVEMISEKSLRLKHKFINADEDDLLSNKGWDDKMAATAGWSIKEALFKWYGLGSVNFREDLFIAEIDSDHQDAYRGKAIVRKHIHSVLHFECRRMGDHCLSWVLG
jgi:phosphopantetheinyl transferase